MTNDEARAKRRMAGDPELAARERAAAVRRTQEWRKRHPERYQKLLREQAAKRREYYAANREKMRAAARASYARHRATKLEKRKAYYRANRDKCRAWWREYRNRPEIKERRHAAALARYARDGAKMREYERNRYRKMCELLAIDAKAYSDFRAKRRVKWVMQLEKPENYRPRFSIRFPDWATKGQRVLDASSAFLACNLSDAQRAYARELAIERKERRAAR